MIKKINGITMIGSNSISDKTLMRIKEIMKECKEEEKK